jgi:hypothetical protein
MLLLVGDNDIFITMSYEATVNTAEILNKELQFFHNRGEPLLLDVDRSPKLEVISFEPLSYRPYGRFWHRAPRVKGSLALRGMLTESHPVRGVSLYGLVGLGDSGFGIEFDAGVEDDRLAVNEIAMNLGHPSPSFRLAP